jgi:WD40 repeat protein/transcriptional regulator with XRE-family HTH domain
MADGPVGTRALASVTTRDELGQLLTELRTRSGRSLRDVGRAIGSGPSTVGDWCRARTLPFPSQDAVFARMLEELDVPDTGPWLEALVRVRGGPRRARREGTAPYRGLDAFRAEDAEWFFGRDDLVERTLKRLARLLDGGPAPGYGTGDGVADGTADGEGPATRNGTAADNGLGARPRLLFVVGPSGSGKSSLLHAGVVPRLRADGLPVATITPGGRPLAALEAAIGCDDPALVLVVDQLEELFTLTDDEQEQEAFLAALARFAASPDGRRAVVAGLRIDFYPHVAAAGPLAPALQDNQVLVGPMSRAELTAAVVEPARRAGFAVEDNLVALVLNDFIPPGSIAGRHDPGSLPLLSHALLETWHHAARGRMTVEDYRAAGGIRRAVEDSAEHAFGELSDGDRARARQVFLRLVRVDRHGVATRRAAPYAELAGLAPDGGGADGSSGPDGPAGEAGGATATAEMPPLVAPFVDARLVTAHESTVELAHEALLAAWPRLRGWIEEDRDGLVLHRRISEATQVWLDHDRDRSALARGARLDSMQQWVEGDAQRHLNRDERDFLAASAASAADAERARQRRARRLRALTATVAVLGLLAGALAVLANHQRSDAVAARDQALSRQLAVAGEQLRDVDPTMAAQLAVRGFQVAPTTQARSTLLESADLPVATRYTGGPGPMAVAASPGGGLVATSNSVDGTVQLFTQGAGGGLVRAGVVEPADPDVDVDVYALVLTPDEDVLVVGDTAPAIGLWDVSDPAAPRRIVAPLAGPSGPIQRLDITADGAELAASGEGDGIFRWDITDPERPRRLPTIPSETVSWGLAYSPDGRHLAFGQDTGEIRLWRLGPEPREVQDLRMGERAVFTVAFAPDGRTLVGGAQDGEARAWDIADPAAPEPIELPENRFRAWVNVAAFSPDGTHLVAGSSDGALRVWDTRDWTHVRDLAHPAPLTQAAFTQDGDVLVTAATDGAARLWELPAVLPPKMAARVFSLAFSDDGTRLAGFSGVDTTVWDVGDPDRPVELADITSPDRDEPFSGSGDMTRDGRLLAQGAVAGTVHLVDVTDPGDPTFVGGPLGGSDQLVEQVAFSADGTLLAAAGDDGTVRIWDVTDPRRPRSTAVVQVGAHIMLNVTWSPTEPLLVVNGADGYTYLYDVADPDAPRLATRLDGFDSESYAAAFTPDGRTLAVGGSDTVVILWDVTEPAEPRRIGEPITGPPSRIYDLAFGPDGTRLIGAVIDGSAWVWDTGDLRSPERWAVLGPFDGPAFTVAVDPEGSLLAASGGDQQIHLWPTDEAATTGGVCARVGEPMTEDEWLTHVPDEPFNPPC